MASRFLTAYVAFVHQARYILLLLWLGLIIGSFFAAEKFPSAVTQDLQPPASSQAFRARQFYRANFYNASHSTGFVFFTDSPTRLNLGTNPNYLQFDRAIQYYCTHRTLDFPKEGFNITLDADPLVTYSSFRAVDEAHFPRDVALQYISETNTSAFATISYLAPQDSEAALDFSRGLSSAIPVLLERYGLDGLVEGNIFSLPTFMDEISASTTKDIITMFGVVLPLALAVFCISLSSLRYIILPILTLVASAFLTFALMYAAAATREVNSLAPGVCAALCLAFVMDYTYFVTAKYKKAVLYQDDEEMTDLEVVEQFLGTGGRAVFISSMSMTACSIGIVFFPIEMLTTVGISCIVASLSAMSVSLNLIPALILTFPNFFKRGAFPWCTPKVPTEAFPSLLSNASPANEITRNSLRASASPQPARSNTVPTNQHQHRASSSNTNAMGHNPHATLLLKRGMIKSYTAESLRGSLYRKGSMRATGYQELPPDPAPFVDPLEPNIKYHHRIVEFVTAWPQNILFVLLTLGIAGIFLAYAFGGRYSNDLTQFVPRNSGLLAPWNKMQKVFKASEVFSYSIMLDLSSPWTYNDIFFQDCHEMIYLMAQRLPQTRVEDFDGVCFDGVQSKSLPNGGNITFGDIVACANRLTDPACLYRLALTFIFKSDSPLFMQTYLMFRPAWNPTSDVGVQWYHEVQEMFPLFEKQFGFKMHITGYGADTIDSVEYADRVLPLIAGIICPILFVIVTIAFGSVIVPLKCLLTVGLTIGCCFGLAKMTFMHNIFGFLQIGGLKGQGSMAWVVPLATFLITAGIALNYDLITIVTILEFRWRGLDSHTAILKGAAATGREITISALMMIIIFSGLFFSEVAAMNELGMFLVASALFQGLFFRVFLTPALMSVLGQYNWFPIQQCSALWNYKPPVLPPQDEPFPASPLDFLGEEIFPVSQGTSQMDLAAMGAADGSNGLSGGGSAATGGYGGTSAATAVRTSALEARRSLAVTGREGQEPAAQSMETFRANDMA